jgi:hypothetical protein
MTYRYSGDTGMGMDMTGASLVGEAGGGAAAAAPTFEDGGGVSAGGFISTSKTCPDDSPRGAMRSRGRSGLSGCRPDETGISVGAVKGFDVTHETGPGIRPGTPQTGQRLPSRIVGDGIKVRAVQRPPVCRAQQ